MKEIKVALIGHGNLGKWHCDKALSMEGVNLVAVVDICAAARKRAQERHPGIATAERIEDVINEIDAALVITPINTHYDLVHYLLENKKHVFCEKACAENYEQLKILEEQVAAKNLILQVGHSERFHQIWEEKNKYSHFFEMPGNITITRVGQYRGRDANVSIVIDLMVHDVDLLLNLFNERPSEVMASGYKIRSDKWDYVRAEFGFASGRHATLIVGRNNVDVARNMEIINENGCLFIDMFRNEVLLASNCSSLDMVVERMSYPKRDHLNMEQDFFFQSIRGKRDVVIGIRDALQVGYILDKVHESLISRSKILL